MNSSSAILICDRDHLFREALRNFLLAAGYARVEVVATVREALIKLRHEQCGCVLIGIAEPFTRWRRLAVVARRRQPAAKIFILVRAADQHLIKDQAFEYMIKEFVFTNLTDLIP